MSLSLADIDQIMTLFERSGFSELKLESGDLKLHLKKAGAPAQARAEPAAPAAPEPAVPQPEPSSGPILPPPGPGEIDVLSPLLGVYYRAPKPGEPPFVEVGRIVEADTIVGIVEVMKLMNTVRAGAGGIVTAIHASNAEMVEYDQPLIRIRTTV